MRKAFKAFIKEAFDTGALTPTVNFALAAFGIVASISTFIYMAFK